MEQDWNESKANSDEAYTECFIQNDIIILNMTNIQYIYTLSVQCAHKG